MKWRIVGAIVTKDLTVYFRNKFIAVITVLGIVAFLVIYFVMPGTASVTNVGLYAPVVPSSFAEEDNEHIDFVIVDSEAALREAVAGSDYSAGIVLPADIMGKFARGEKPDVKIYFSPETTEEMRELYRNLVLELAFEQTGQLASFNETQIVVGTDLLGQDIPLRERMRPFFAVMLLMIEMFGLANLIAVEVERRTVQGLLVTPMRVRELFAAKGITGIILAFVPAALFMALVGGMNSQPLVILTAMLLGVVMIVGISFLVSSLSKDFMSILGWVFVALIIMAIPAVGIMMSGTITGWAKAIPSYYLVLPVHQAAHYGSGWGFAWPYLLALAGFDLAFIGLGIMALRRKFQ
ncbi:ABC transporter permease [Chloroflexota bacterium]